jgi:kinetochore protein Nuf2
MSSQHDAFPLLDAKELAVCLQSIDIPATEELVTRPNSVYIRQTLEQILELFIGISPQDIEKRANLAYNSDSQPNGGVREGDDDDDTKPVLSLIILHRITHKFLNALGVHDLTISDIMRPEPHRIRRILSAVINYARFLEEHSADAEDLMAETETYVEQIRKIQQDNESTKQSLENLKMKLESNDSQPKRVTLKQVNTYNSKLELELKRLKKSQEVLTLAHTQYKEEKIRLIEKVDDLQYLAADSAKEIERLRGYSEIDVEILNKIIADLKVQLTTLQDQYNEKNEKNSNMTITIESIQLVENDLKNLFPMLEEISRILLAEKEALANLDGIQDAHDNLSKEAAELAIQLGRHERENTYNLNRLEKLKKQTAERINKCQQDVIARRQDHAKIVETRRRKEEEFATMKQKISEIENKIQQLKSNYSNEIRLTRLKIERLNSQVSLYMKEVGKKL